jgi:outer membrane receptor protein involved in Fe transport
MRNLFFLLLFLPFSLSSQSSYTISGTVKDSQGEPVAFANVVLNKNNKYGVTDENGKFRIANVSSGDYELRVSYIGYETYIQKINVQKDLALAIVLKETAETLESIRLIAKTESAKQNAQALSISSLNVTQLQNQALGVEAVLKQSTGVVLRQNGGLGSAVNINLNGLQGSAVRLYYDGLPIELYGGAIQVNFIPVDALERVDVYKGVMPIDIGTDALGGGINFVSSRKNQPFLRTSYTIGSFNTHRFNFSGRFQFNNKISASILSYVNYSDNDYRMRNIRSIVENVDANGNVSISEEIIDVRRFHDQFRSVFVEGSVKFQDFTWADELVISGGIATVDSDIQNGTQLAPTAVGEAVRGADSYLSKLRYNKGFLDNKLRFNINALYSESTNYTRDFSPFFYNWRGERLMTLNSLGNEISGAPTDREGDNYNWGVRLTANYDFSDNVTLSVSNYSEENSVQGRDPLAPTVIIDGVERDPNSFESLLKKNIFGAELAFKFFDETLETQVFYKNYSYDANSVDIDAARFSSEPLTEVPFINVTKNFNGFGAALKYIFSEEFFVRTSFERAVRLPNIGEVFGDFAAVRPNFEIRPEQSDNFNFGINFRKRWAESKSFIADVGVFLRNQEDLIRPVPFGAEGSRFINEDDNEAKGIEASFKYTHSDVLSFTSGFTAQRLQITDIGDDSSARVGADIPNIAKLFFNFGVNYRIEKIFNTPNRFDIAWNYFFIDRYSINEVISLDDANPLFVIPRQHLNNVNFSYSMPNQNLVITLGINNVFDQEIFDNWRVPRPGRNFNFKLNYSL